MLLGVFKMSGGVSETHLGHLELQMTPLKLHLVYLKLQMMYPSTGMWFLQLAQVDGNFLDPCKM